MKPPLSALFVEVGIGDGGIATPYILGSGSPQKKGLSLFKCGKLCNSHKSLAKSFKSINLSGLL